MSDKFDVCEHCGAWVGSVEGSVESIRDTYPDMMRKVLRHCFHMHKKAADYFIDDACGGNWERMHLTGPENYIITSEQWAKQLLNEVAYFSDRWTWDRVMRAQWIYKRLCDSLDMQW